MIAVIISAIGGAINANIARIIEQTKTPPETESDTLNSFAPSLDIYT